MENKPENIFLVHGEYGAQQALKSEILDRYNINTVIPDYEETYTIDGKLVESNIPKYKSTRFDILEMLSILKQDVEDVSNSVKVEMKQASDQTELEIIKSKLEELKQSLEKIKSIK